MKNMRHVLHAVVIVGGIAVGGVLAVFTGDPAVTLMFSGGIISAAGYWLGAAAHRKHG